MCGIAGFVCATPPSGADAVLARMTGAIAHRGPDDCHVFLGPPAFLGHRRLSIIDLSGGHQPMSNEDRSLVRSTTARSSTTPPPAPPLKRPAIATQATATPKPSSTPTSSTAPPASPCSAACSHSPSGTSAARSSSAPATAWASSRFTTTGTGRLFAFASEIKALFEHPAISPAPRRRPAAGVSRLRLFERRADPVSRHPQADAGPSPDARLLRPRHPALESVNTGTYPPRRACPFAEPVQRRGLDRRNASPPGRNRRMRLMSDVPLGMFLSGGVDSSAIAALIKRNTSLSREDLRGRLPRGAVTAS